MRLIAVMMGCAMRFRNFLGHSPRCTRQHFLVSSVVAVAGTAALVGCAGGASTVGMFDPRKSPLGKPGLDTTPLPLPPNPALGGLSVQIPNAPGAGLDPITIYDFNGDVGRAIIDGAGVGNGSPLFFEVDTAFMDGVYRSVSGKNFQGTFVFV